MLRVTMKTLGLVAIALAGVGHSGFAPVIAAGPQNTAGIPQPQRTGAQVAAAAPSRALLDQYCVGCHNDRVKSGNLILTNIDIADIGRHAALLEKVARKLHGGT